MTQKYDKELFKKALSATAAHRGTSEQISDIGTIIQTLSESKELKDMWDKYRKQFVYAVEISYEDIIAIIKTTIH